MGKVLKAWGGWGTQTEVYFPGNPRSHVLLKQYATEGLGDLKHTVGTIDGAGKAEGDSGETEAPTSFTPISSNPEISWTLGLILCLVFFPHKMS